MISAEFRETGWQINRTAKTRAYQVFGERSSGTNFVKRLIGRNSPLHPTEKMGWKHGFPQMTAIPSQIAIVCVVRDARAWALSMHAKPWHSPPAMQALPFKHFIRSEWATIADRGRYFPSVEKLGGEGQPLQIDRHPLTGQPFANLFALRRAKMNGLLSYYNRGCTVVFCRLDAVHAAPEAFLADLHAGLKVAPPEHGFRPIHKRLGAKFLPAIQPRPDTPKTLSASELQFMRDQLDLEQEAALGFDYF